MIDNINNGCASCGVIAPSNDHLVEQFEKKENLAQYKNSDYSNAVQVARNISVLDAMKIAANNSDIDYFFIQKEG